MGNVHLRDVPSLLGLGLEKTDEELATEQTEQAKEIATVGFWDWKRVCRYRARGELLVVAEKRGQEGVSAFLRELTRLHHMRLNTS
jgi:hypothetical protein